MATPPEALPSTAQPSPLPAAAALLSRESGAGGPERRAGGAPRFRYVPDLLALAVYVALSLYLTSGLWSRPDRRVFPWTAGSDQMLLQWQLAHAAHAVRHLSNPFFTTDLNAPMGVNLAANANILGLGIPLTPITLLAGPAVAYCVLATGSLAMTALAWYWVLSRPLALSRGAAFVGGLFCGFAPLMVVESHGHLHVVAQFLVPLIVWRFTRLAHGDRPVRDGAILGALVAYQGLIGEEILLFVAIGVAVFALGYVAQRPRAALAVAPGVMRGLVVAALVATAALAVPLAYQFAGPQHFTGNPIDPQAFPADLLHYVGLPKRISHWLPGGADFWSAGAYPTLGLPVVLVLLMFGWPLRRNTVFVSTLAVLGVFLVLSLGTEIIVRHSATGIPGPWRLVARLPVFEWVIPGRLGQMAVPAAGVMIALILDRARARWSLGARFVPAVAVLTTACALATLTPTPLVTEPVPAIPRFISEGAWREFVPEGRSLMTVPVPSLTSFDGMRWSAASGVGFAIPGGYFLGPSADGKKTLFGPPAMWTTMMLDAVAATGKVWPIAAGDRERLRHDLWFWRVSVLALAPHQRNAPALRATLEEFLGPARSVSDVLLWVIRNQG